MLGSKAGSASDLNSILSSSTNEPASSTNEPASRRRVRGFRDNMLCPCAELTHANFAAFLREHPGLNFEEVLSRTGAGTNCTACMLDLEFSFSEAGGGQAAGTLRPTPVAAGRSTDLKRTIYRVIDGVAPMVSSRTDTLSPVLFGKDVRQSLWIANQRLLYDASADGPVPHIAEVTVRDDAGQVLHEKTYEIAVDAVLNLDLSEFCNTQTKGDALGVGSARVVQHWTQPGLRGTTRAQIEIEAPNAACAVHTQAPGPAGPHRFTALYKPSEERLFHTVVNPRPDALTGKATIRFIGSDEEVVKDVVIPGFGAVMDELFGPSNPSGLAEGEAVDLRWEFDGPHKLHIVCASPALDRFSIDHL